MFTGCVLQLEIPPPLTPLQIQSIQTREFNTTVDTAFSSVIAAMQNQRYQIKTADKQSGFIAADRSTDDDSFADFLKAQNNVNSATTRTDRITAYIESLPNSRILVRLNIFKSYTSSARGVTSSNDKSILDPVRYQKIFEQIASELFLRSK